MAGADLYGAAISFLDGDGGDVFSTVNAAFTGTLVSGSVTASRGGTGVSPRKAVTPATTVEIVPAGARVERVIGIGWVEVDLAFDLKCTVRKKSTPAGKTQLAAVEAVARALRDRYAGKSNLTVTVTGNLATFRRAACSVTSIDEIPEAGEQARSVARLVLTFTQDLGDNT
jgi:hypothetical protein